MTFPHPSSSHTWTKGLKERFISDYLLSLVFDILLPTPHRRLQGWILLGLVTATEKTAISESTGTMRRRRGWTPTRLALTLGINSPSLFTLPARSSCHPSHVYIYCESFFSRKQANGCPLINSLVIAFVQMKKNLHIEKTIQKSK